MRGSVRQFCYVSAHFRYILTIFVLIRNILRRVAQSIFTFENAVMQKWHKEKRQKGAASSFNDISDFACACTSKIVNGVNADHFYTKLNWAVIKWVLRAPACIQMILLAIFAVII